MNICVIFGGASEEYKVSLATAYEILTGLDKLSHKIHKIGVTREGKWYYYGGSVDKIKDDTWHTGDCEVVLPDLSRGCFLLPSSERELYFDKAVLAMHGTWAEDGRIISLLELMGLPFLSTSSASSLACFDKHITKLVARELEIDVAKDAFLTKNSLTCENQIYREAEKIGYPLFVKPTKSGSSVGVCRVTGKEELLPAVKNALSISPVLLEEAIDGRECELAVIIKNGTPRFSKIGELSFGGGFYDYSEKYEKGRTEYTVPAKIPKESELLIYEYARLLVDALEITELCRIDFFVKRDGGVVFNEINTLPGFTKISMFPRLFINEGLSFCELLDYLLT